jgi:uncharacterized membrane protein
LRQREHGSVKLHQVAHAHHFLSAACQPNAARKPAKAVSKTG